MTRRQWLRFAFSALACPGATRFGRAQGLDWTPPGEPEFRFERRYRADAQVILLGISLLHREGVGGGRVSWSEWRDGIRQLEFAGYSIPERAAGLSRLGFLRELSRSGEAGLAESIYFGLMSASPEESAEEARKALHSKAKEAVYTAIEAHVAPGEAQTAIAHFAGPAGLPAGELTDLEARARQALHNAPRQQTASDPQESAPPFLHALASALRQGSAPLNRYTYSGRLYRLSLRKAPDSKATAEFRTRRQLAEGRQAVRVSGVVQREQGGRPIEFRLWVEADAPRPIPLRIEFQAKSYLRLIFEAV